MRKLIIDVEMSPAVAYIWDLRTRYVPPDNIKEQKHLLCFAAAWHQSGEVLFYSEWEQGRLGMARALVSLLDEADTVIGYNSRRFDVPAINTEILLAGLDPPSPFQQVDLYLAVRNRFKFMSSSLAEVTRLLGTESKLHSGGMRLWKEVLDGDEAARMRMRAYNMQDVVATEALHDRLLPWLPSYPNANLDKEAPGPCCPACGSADLEKRGYSRTALSKFQRFQCRACGKWSRDGRSMARAGLRDIAA